MFVIDASAMLPWLFEDEDDPVATVAARRATTELAKRHAAGLATLDEALATAARNVGVELVGRRH